MLRYEIKLGNDNFKIGELVWREKYLSPDLSFISGVTDTSYHIEKFEALSSKNSINNTDSTLFVEAHNVTRQGFVIVKNKRYSVEDGQINDYMVPSEISYRYVEYNGKYYYYNNSIGGYKINTLVIENGDVKDGSVVIECNSDDAEIAFDEIFWIEDNSVRIDGNTYIYDRYEGDMGILKYGESGAPIDPSDITNCDDIEYFPFESSNDFYDVTKFTMTKADELPRDYSKLTYLRRYYYVLYKNHYCNVRKKYEDGKYSFVCDVPQYVIDGTDGNDGLKPNEYDLYFTYDIGDSEESVYDAAFNNGRLVNEDNYDLHMVKELDELDNVHSFIKIDDAYFTVNSDILNTNYGGIIGLHLDDENTPLGIGSTFSFVSNVNDGPLVLKVYNSEDYNGGNENFVIYDGSKYPIKKNLCDKVEINNVMYDIRYINGKIDDEDCLVLIEGEEVPFKISNSGKTLVRYGKVVIGDTVTTATYDVISYSGVTINGRDYIVYDNTKKRDDEENDGDDEVKVIFASTDLPNRIKFKVDEIKGSSLYVCSPDLNKTNFTDDFRRLVSPDLCSDVMSNRSGYSMIIKNKIFGDVEITSDIAFRNTQYPVSSDDFYDLLNDLTIYINNAFIQIPISFSTDMASDGLLGDIVKRDFYEAEKEKAINPIVDMEKDVYLPKYFDGIYNGASTDFKPIYEINFNFHFRTRNLQSWKVNESNNNIESNGYDNWFITDFYPYVGMNGDDLETTSDLMGLLYFTNDDIYYQKSKVGKSFARLSFYDSTDPQTQSLLATSCVFVDEHKLFKTYIDNSRKNVNKYVSVTQYEAENEGNPADFMDTRIKKLNKISVMSELAKGTGATIEATIDEAHRISSRLTVSNKYVTDTSSEGYYLYMFREYAEKLHPKPIYMKVEFNHAGIGKTIPFLIPMKWNEDITKPNSNKLYPTERLKLKNENDLKELKKGIPVSYVYAQSYIPLYAVYDFKNKEYAYVFDRRYVDVNADGVVNLNLFEMKIKDESNKDVSDEKFDEMLKEIRQGRQKKAVININSNGDKRQFNLNNL